MTDIQRTIDAVWRIESARIVATLARLTGDLGLAEDLAQEALVDALTQWPETGVPRNAGAWLTAVAKRKAIDSWRRRQRLDQRYRTLAHDLSLTSIDQSQSIEDDVIRLIFIACHPVLSRGSQVALTLRVVAGLTTEEIGRLLLLPIPTVQQRIVRAKKTLAAAQIPFETPEPAEWSARLNAVLAVVYLLFTEGYAATSGDRWMRTEIANEALRLGRVLASLLPREPEVLGLLALMELQASRFGARTTADGDPILLGEQNRLRWDRTQIARGRAVLARADSLGRGRANYALQAAIAECHAVALSVEQTDWAHIVRLYAALGQLAPSPLVDLNRAVAVSMASGPAAALPIVDQLAAQGQLPGSYLLSSVRGELLAQLGRTAEARAELLNAASLATNQRQRALLQAKAAAL